MKIGIITWFTGTNYGTHLQVIALQQYLRSIGHEVYIINFEVNTAHKKSGFWERLCRQPAKYAMKYANRKFIKQIEKRDIALVSIIQNQCRLTERIDTEEDYIRVCNQFDVLICGSDQIWNPNWYHRMYYADYPTITATKISYAPSVGVNAIPKRLESEIRRSLKFFKAVSVREESGAELLTPLSPVTPQVVVDPTFLLNEKEWIKIASQNQDKRKPYVLCMFLTDKKGHWRAAHQFAKKNNLEYVIVPYGGFSYLQHGRICAGTGIEELLTLIKEAAYILTDSFHITVFSMIFKRQFITFQRFKENETTSQNARVANLLKMVGIPERMIPYKSSVVPNMDTIDYKAVDQILKEKIDLSKYYLSNALGDEK